VAGRLYESGRTRKPPARTPIGGGLVANGAPVACGIISIVTETDATSTDDRSRPPVRPLGLAGGYIGRNVATASMSVILVVGVGLLVAGLEIVRVSPLWGFSYDGALKGILSQLSVTAPAAVLVAVAVGANILAGAVVLRFLGTPAFERVSDLVLAGFSAAVMLDSLVLFVLGSLGFFGWPELLLLHLAVAAAYAVTRRERPLLARQVRFRVSRPAAWWVLVLAVWSGPLIIQLASPAVPFMDVLPNHTAPVEHIRVFGSFATLTTSPSPIYGPSRLMLGYIALLGQATTITNLEAVLAEAAFALPLTILVALALRRLTGQLFGGSASFWVLVTFPLTFTFMRIPDSRATVTVFPVAAWVLSSIAAELNARAGSAWQSRRPDIGLTFALAASFLVHPLMGLVAVTAAGLALIMYPARLSRRLVPALAGGLVMAAPQVLTMGAIDAPAWVGAIFLLAGVAVAFAVAPVVAVVARLAEARTIGWRAAAVYFEGSAPPADLARAALLGGAIVVLLIWARAVVVPSGDPSNPTDPSVELMLDFPHLVWLSLLGVALSVWRLRRGWVLLGCGIVAGLAGWTASGFVGSADLTQQAVHYEVPKSIEYWLPVMLAIGAAGALTAIVRLRPLGAVRPLAICLVLIVAVYPSEYPLATNVQIGEHRAAESLGLALREAQLGYWNFNGYPDTRTIIDAPRQEVVDELRSEEAAGRLGPSTRVLNIAWWFQEWVAVPIGVFTGAMETSISLSPELSIHTVGGRLYGFDRLVPELDSHYGYVVLQPDGLPADVVASTENEIIAAGYRRIWSNSLAIVYAGG